MTQGDAGAEIKEEDGCASAIGMFMFEDLEMEDAFYQSLLLKGYLCSCDLRNILRFAEEASRQWHLDRRRG
jgi:hypothetical protein